MRSNFVLEASLPVMMLLLCLGVPIVQAEGALSNWTSPTTEFLYSVYMMASDDGWAVGYAGTIIRWNGTQWSNATSPTGDFLRSVHMVGSDDGWAVATYGAIIHWNGTEWSIVTSPINGNWVSVFMVASDDGWAVGTYGRIIHWTGTEWIPEFSPIILMSLLIGLTLVAVVWAKTASKKRARRLSSKI